ncbi:DUF308 domain-containing protein [Williamsia sp.]|uniref:HdeD family acid-resistance protein n=1 Tax=Williamsia sp. TaxID=1872085 RepID=UPI001A215836|nr:DUF308 domain-containing protein [Williamsia sp.]MBJ7289634.1 DUF308 domain-containing protein [Williamsia sp.]
MTTPTTSPHFPDQIRNAVRAGLISTSVLGIVLGIIALVWPGPTLLVVAVLFGISLILTGAYRLSIAFSAKGLPTGLRVVFGVVGAIILIAGVLCLFDPAESLVLLAIVIGVGWIFQGVHDLMSDRAGTHNVPRWVLVLSGAISIIAGIVVITLPGLAIGTFITFGAILLIVVSVVNLLTLPRKV